MIINYRGGPHVPRADIMTTNTVVNVRFLIGVEPSGREHLFTAKHIPNAAVFCCERCYHRIDGVDFNARRFVVYTNPWSLVVGYNAEAEVEDLEAEAEEYENSKKKSSSEEDDYF